MPRVYGDSTPFPYDLDYIELLKQAIDCSVQLLSAQQSINVAAERFQGLERVQQSGRNQLSNMGDAVQVAMAHFQVSPDERVSRVAVQIAERAQHAVEEAQRGFEDEVSSLASQTRTIIERARDGAYRGVENLLRTHDVPGSMQSLKLVASQESYRGRVIVRTPFAIDAVFGLAIPPEHFWARPRRVAELTQGGAEIHAPRESGWLSKRVELAPTKLDRLFISEATLGEMQSIVRLRRGPDSGAGFQLSVNLEKEPRTVLLLLHEDGSPDSEPIALGNEDGGAVLGLWRRLADSMVDLFGRRQEMLSSDFDERPLREVEMPRVVAERIISELAPLAIEISRRSGAPGELVLRRTLGEGRREETYATKAELRDKTLVLPPDLRAVFDPLGLGDIPRTSLGAAPAHGRGPGPSPVELRQDESPSSHPVPISVQPVAHPLAQD